MFENSSVLVIAGGTHANQIYRIEVDERTQEAICKAFSNAKNDLVDGKEAIEFDGSYKPNINEFLYIPNYLMADEIKDAIRDPLGVAKFECISGEFPEIKAIFVGERTEEGTSEQFKIAFQKFKKEQYISTKWYNLFFENSAFLRRESYGISISDMIECYYDNGRLMFASFYYAKQIFELGAYYRIATEGEVNAFSSHTKLSLEDADGFNKMADTWIRRKIAMINDSDVLNNYAADVISQYANKCGICIDIDHERIVIPNDKQRVKAILGFLDEEAYKGPFSQNTYLANSKRQIGR